MALKPRPTEWLLGGYAVVVIGVAVARAPANPAAGWVALSHALLLVLLLAFQSARVSALGATLRDVVPILLLLALYGALDVLNDFGARPTHDALIQGLEQALFGMQVSHRWWQLAPSAVASWVGHAAYFSYYLIIPFPIALHLSRGDPPAARRAVFTIMTAFVMCYLWFVFFPVAGPYYEFARPDPWFTANWPARMVYGVLSGGSSFGAAFPSSHVAGTWAAVAATAERAPRWGALLALPAALLTIGVVYCQMHYAVDALAGLGVAAAAVVTSSRVDRIVPAS